MSRIATPPAARKSFLDKLRKKSFQTIGERRPKWLVAMELTRTEAQMALFMRDTKARWMAADTGMSEKEACDAIDELFDNGLVVFATDGERWDIVPVRPIPTGGK